MGMGMEDGFAFIDIVFLLGGLVVIVFTGVRVSRRRSGSKPAEGQSMATVGILIWLALLGVALYLIFG
jgi:hypothetical protein